MHSVEKILMLIKKYFCQYTVKLYSKISVGNDFGCLIHITINNQSFSAISTKSEQQWHKPRALQSWSSNDITISSSYGRHLMQSENVLNKTLNIYTLELLLTICGNIIVELMKSVKLTEKTKKSP